jgi:hypothetical protein
VSAKLRAEARRLGQPFKQVVNHFLRLGLTSGSQLKPARPFVVKARALGLRPGLDYDNTAELLEQIEGSCHR